MGINQCDFSGVQDFLRKTADNYGDRFFFRISETEVMFSEIKTLWEKGAAFLQSQGITGSEKIILSLKNGPEFILSFGAIILAKAIPVIINPDAPTEQLKEIALLSEAEYSVSSKTIPGIENFKKDEFSLDLRKQSSRIYKYSSSKKNDIAYYIFTSGSTGKMKGVCISHLNFLSELGSLIRAYKLTSEDTHLCVLPLYHASALFRNFLLPFSLGAKTVVVPDFDINSFWGLIDKYNIAFVQVVPTILSMLLKSPNLPSPNAVNKMKFIGTASAPCPLNLIQEFEDKFKIKVIEGYGLTETTCGATLNPVDATERKTGSIGKPVDVATIKIVDDHGNEMSPNQRGEIRISGPLVAAGYLTKEDQPRNSLGNGTIMTGDIGYMDEDSFIYIVDRKTDLIYRGGFKISPKEVDEQLFMHPNIEAAVTFSIPHKLLGEDIICYVKPRRQEKFNEGKLRAYLREKLIPYKIPTRIYSVPELFEAFNLKVSRSTFRSHYLDSKDLSGAKPQMQKQSKEKAFLVGDSVYLRPIMEKDITSDIYLTNIMTREFQRYTLSGRFPQSETAIREHWNSLKIPDSIALAICDLQTDEYVGNITLRFDWVARKAEFGRMIFRDFQHKPYSIAAMKLIMEYVFEDLKLHRLWGGGGNPSSVPSLLELGFTYEGRMRQHSLLGGEWRDLFIMGIIDEEYFSLKTGTAPKRRQLQYYSPEILTKVIQVVSEVFDVEVKNLDEKNGPSDISDWDSLGTVALWSCLEEKFAVQISPDDMIWITSVGDLAIMIEGKKNE